MNYYTHGGFFHADEVFGYAICYISDVCENFVRITDLENIPQDGIVADIGREWKPEQNKFDHHHGFFPRPNSVPYASAGMLWEKFGEIAVVLQLFKPSDKALIQQIKERVDETLIQGIDAHDADSAYHFEATCSAGKVRALSISNIIAMMNSDDVSDHEAQRDAFDAASNIAMRIIQQAIKAAEKHIQAKNKFADVAEIDGPVIVLSEGLPWKEIVHESYPDALFVISPSNHPGNPFSMVAVPVDP